MEMNETPLPVDYGPDSEFAPNVGYELKNEDVNWGNGGCDYESRKRTFDEIFGCSEGGENEITTGPSNGPGPGVPLEQSSSRRGRPKGSKNKKKKIDPPQQQSSHTIKAVDLGEVNRELVDGVCGNGVTEIGERKGRRGRPKGSKNSKKFIQVEEDKGLLPVETVSGNDGGHKIVRKVGRPKGSKNKKTILRSEEKIGLPVDLVSGNDSGNWMFETEVKGHTPEEKLDMPRVEGKQIMLCDEENLLMPFVQENLVMPFVEEKQVTPDATITPKDVGVEEKRDMPGENSMGKGGIKRVGRPKGSKNKKKIITVNGNKGSLGEVAVSNGTGNGISKRKDGRGRPKNRKKNHGTNLRRGLLGEVVKKKAGRGRPKGLKNKKNIIADEERQHKVSGIEQPVVVDKSGAGEFASSGHEIVPQSLSSVQPNVANGDQINAIDSVLTSDGGDMNVSHKKRKLGRHQGTKKKPCLVIGNDNCFNTDGGKSLPESIPLKKRRGRPRKYVDEVCTPVWKGYVKGDEQANAEIVVSFSKVVNLK